MSVTCDRPQLQFWRLPTLLSRKVFYNPRNLVSFCHVSKCEITFCIKCFLDFLLVYSKVIHRSSGMIKISFSDWQTNYLIFVLFWISVFVQPIFSCLLILERAYSRLTFNQNRRNYKTREAWAYTSWHQWKLGIIIQMFLYNPVLLY